MEIQGIIEKIIKCQILIEYYEEQLEQKSNIRIESNLELINRKMRDLLENFRFELLVGNLQFNIIILGYLVKLKENSKHDVIASDICNYLKNITWENINDFISQMTYEEFEDALSYVDHLIIKTENVEIKKEFERVYIAISNSIINDTKPPCF